MRRGPVLGRFRCHPGTSLAALALLVGPVAGPATAAGRPDLVVTSATRAPASLEQGDRFVATVKVKNRGNRSARQSTVRLYLSADQRKDAFDFRLTGQRGIPLLKAGKSFKGKGRFVVPVSVPLETFHLIACADDRKRLRESNERNNCRSAAGDVEIVEPVSSYDLIDRAVADGDIDEETGLLYKIYRDFSDPRLPAPYEGNDAGVLEPIAALEEAATTWDTLSPDTQAALAPFFVLPIYEESWFAVPTRAPRALSVREGPDPDFCTDAQAWASVDTANGKVRVWYQKRYGKAERTNATTLAGVIDTTIWPKLKNLMGREPLPDGGSIKQCRGGDDRLDLLLMNVGRSVTFRYPDTHCDNSPAYIYLSRNDGPEIAAHEIMHAFQDSYDVVGCLADYRWLMEATAQWAQDFVHPNTQTEQHVADDFLNDPRTSLEVFEQDGLHQYGAYLLPFFRAGQGRANAAVVRRIWDNTQTMSSLDAVDAEMPGGFVDGWKDFVLSNWNRWIVDHYAQWDGLTDGAYPEGGQARRVSLNGKSENTVNVSAGVQHLAASYKWYEFESDVRYVEYNNSLVSNADADVQAIVTLADGTQNVENWTARPKRKFCRKNENVASLVVIVSNHSQSARLPNAGGQLVVKDKCPLEYPRTWTGTVEGTYTPTDPLFTGVTERWTATVTFTLSEDFPGTPFYRVSSGNVHYQREGTDQAGCTHQGSGDIALGPEDGELTLTQDLTQYHGSSEIQPPGDYFYSYTSDCPDPDPDHEIGGPFSSHWFLTDDLEPMDPGDRGLSGTFHESDDLHNVSWTWDLTAGD